MLNFVNEIVYFPDFLKLLLDFSFGSVVLLGAILLSW